MATVTRCMQTHGSCVRHGSARSTVQVSTYQKFAWETQSSWDDGLKSSGRRFQAIRSQLRIAIDHQA